MVVVEGLSNGLTKEDKSIWFPLLSSGWEVVICRSITCISGIVGHCDDMSSKTRESPGVGEEWVSTNEIIPEWWHGFTELTVVIFFGIWLFTGDFNGRNAD
jgi:hypothetical protein